MLSAVALVKGLDTMFLTNALAKPNAGPDYKALVCVFLFGGNDANNIVIPYTAYDDVYGAIRGAPGVGLAIQRENLLQITPPSDPLGNIYGLHPALGAGATNRGIFGLFNEGKAAILPNTGTMIDPLTTKDQLRAGINRPYQLFSHSDQQSAWQSSRSIGPSGSGVGGRIADVFHGGAQVFPVVTSISGVQVFTQGTLTRPLIASAAPTRIDQLLVINRDFAPDNPIDQIVALDRGDGSATLVRASANIAQDSLDIRADLRTAGNPTIDTPFPTPATGIGNQLLQVAKLIKTSRDFLTNVTRQIFFVSIGGFDTHQNQGTETGQQANLWSQVSQAMTAFYDATVELGLSDQVTAFTMSDFSRTLKPANPGGGVGSDHAWAGHHFVIGGAVGGGDFYGRFPDLTIGGPQDYDLDETHAGRGRYIPSQGVDQVAYTLAKWYGVPLDQLPTVVPNIIHYQGIEDLGFMRTGNAPRAVRSARAG
jgi:uncharacterized protein (DUF1501 family)